MMPVLRHRPNRQLRRLHDLAHRMCGCAARTGWHRVILRSPHHMHPSARWPEIPLVIFSGVHLQIFRAQRGWFWCRRVVGGGELTLERCPVRYRGVTAGDRLRRHVLACLAQGLQRWSLCRAAPPRMVGGEVVVAQRDIHEGARSPLGGRLSC